MKVPQVRRLLEGLLEGKTLAVVVKHDQPVTEGRFLLGGYGVSEKTAALVFDSSQSNHRALANRYNLRPWGGGWLSLDTGRKRIRITGVSQDYGKEPDRELTRRALERAFPDYEVTEV